MNKKIPKVFENHVESDGNNERVYYSEKSDINVDNSLDETKNINQKIKDIFNSSSYVYKADVQIKLKSGWCSKRLVGRNSSNLITMENELIPISDVLDIKMR